MVSVVAATVNRRCQSCDRPTLPVKQAIRFWRVRSAPIIFDPRPMHARPGVGWVGTMNCRNQFAWRIEMEARARPVISSRPDWSLWYGLRTQVLHAFPNFKVDAARREDFGPERPFENLFARLARISDILFADL